MRSRSKTLFYCTECGNEFAKWAGKCPACGAWNTIVEQPERPSLAALGGVRGGAGRGGGLSGGNRAGMAGGTGGSAAGGGGTDGAGGGPGGFLARRASPVTEITETEEVRFPTGLGELDRVLGGGAVQGSLVLVGGAPGIGKSTLLLQICGRLCVERRVLYVSGEESERQLKLRAKRLHVEPANLLAASLTNLADVLDTVAVEQPDALIVDSIQTLYNDALDSPAGSVSQVKECTLALMRLAKEQGVTVFVIGHVNKEGSIAGPKVLEHMVDCVLTFEGDSRTSYRILRAAKNRFGATNEIGVFEMRDSGLAEVGNPSELLLSGRPEDAPGTCVACVMEGARPVLAEVQALLAPSAGGKPLRTANGFEYNRFAMLQAVLEKRGGLRVSVCDAYLNIVGGLWLDEPAADLAVILAMASSYLDKILPRGLAAVGEVGLTGELRSVNHLDQRISEVQRLGFASCIIPAHRADRLKPVQGLRLLPARNIGEALRAALGNPEA